MSNYFRWNAGRKRQGTPTLESQPGAHTGNSRQYIPGYSDSNIIYLDTAAGNDGNAGTSEGAPKLTYASAATAAGSTKKIRVINNGAALPTNITKPTEMKRGLSGTISSSLTAPVDTWTQAATPGLTNNIRAVAYSDKLALYVAANDSGKTAYSADGNTWNVNSGTLASGGTLDFVTWIPEINKFFLGGENATIANSDDGQVWREDTLPSLDTGGTSAFVGIAYSGLLGRIVAVTQDGGVAYSDDDGVSWSVILTLLSTITATHLIYSSYNAKYYMTSTSGIFLSSDGINWSAADTQPTGQISTMASNESGILVAVGGSSSPEVFRSTNGGLSWAAASSVSLTTSSATGVIYVPEISRFVTGNVSGQIAFSSNGDTWTNAATPSYGGTAIRRFVYSPLKGRLVSVGNSAKIAYSTAFANTISANIAGFTVQAMQYSGTVTTYNCTMYQPGTTASLNLNACRITEPGAHISNNAQSHFGTLFEGDAYFTTVPASANAFDFNCNTAAGTVYIFNGSETHYERIRDNIIEGGVQATYPATVTSGNTRGTSSDGVIFGQFHTTADPLFVDETDYKLQRVLDGYQYDSPLVAGSQYYLNANSDFRDVGAWSYNESGATYKYQRTIDFPMPAAIAGSTIEFIRHNRSNLHVAEDGTPDTVNQPDARWEEIVMTFKTVGETYIDFIDWLEGQVDMTCSISLAPDLTPTTAVTASGSTSAGEAVITITDNSGLDSGDRLTIDGNQYTVLYTYGTTKVVLDRTTTTALTDTESISVKSTTGEGEYQYVPQLERRLSRWYETDSTYQRGLAIRFARKLP